MTIRKNKNRNNKKKLNSDWKIKQKGIRHQKEIKAYSSLDNFPILFFTILCAYVIAFFAFRYYISYKAINISDVNKINGTIKQYELEGTKSKTFDIKLKEYSGDFYISAEAINYKSFEQNETKGNNISFLINKNDYMRLKDNSNVENGSIEVYGISTDKYDYLDVNDFNDYRSYQAKCGIILGIIMILSGTFLLYYLIKYA